MRPFSEFPSMVAIYKFDCSCKPNFRTITTISIVSVTNLNDLPYWYLCVAVQ